MPGPLPLPGVAGGSLGGVDSAASDAGAWLSSGEDVLPSAGLCSALDFPFPVWNFGECSLLLCFLCLADTGDGDWRWVETSAGSALHTNATVLDAESDLGYSEGGVRADSTRSALSLILHSFLVLGLKLLQM